MVFNATFNNISPICRKSQTLYQVHLTMSGIQTAQNHESHLPSFDLLVIKLLCRPADNFNCIRPLSDNNSTHKKNTCVYTIPHNLFTSHVKEIR